VALRRMEQAGATLTTTASILAELAVNFATEKGAEILALMEGRSHASRRGLRLADACSSRTRDRRPQQCPHRETWTPTRHLKPGSASEDPREESRMHEVLRASEQERSPGGTLTFEGEEHGSGVSFFLVNSEPGAGPDLHTHPYSETWIVRSGEVAFTAAEQEL